MNLDEAFKVLCEVRKNPARKWQIWKGDFRPPSNEASEACQMLASSPPEITIPQLACLLLNAEESFLEKFDPLFIELLGRLPISLWPVTDEKSRAQTYYCPENSRFSDPRFLHRYPSLLIIAICHPSGRARQQAIRDSDCLNPELAVPLLLIRANDWVEQVRNEAASKLTEPLKTLKPVAKMAVVPLVLRLRKCGRLQRPALLETWLKILVTPFDEAAWLAAWHSAKGRQRKDYLEILKNSSHQPAPTARRQLLQSNDRFALFWLIREVLPTLPTGERDEEFSLLSKSRVVTIKREWLSYRVAFCGTEEAEQLLKDALLDSSRGIRQFARFHLSQSTTMDFPSFYRDALSRPKNEAAALEALAEVSPEEAHREALGRLDSKTPSVLKAAIKSLANTTLGNHLDFLLYNIGSKLPGVPKAARKRLYEIRRLAGIELIAHPERWDSFPETTQIHLIRLAPEFQKWDGFEFLLCQLRGESAREHLLKSLWRCQSKVSRSFSKLQKARKEKLLGYVESAGLSVQHVEDLRFLIAHAE